MIREIIRPNSGTLQVPIPSSYINEEVEVIVFKTSEGNTLKKPNEDLLKEFQKLSQDIPKFNSNVDLIKLDENINNDIF